MSCSRAHLPRMTTSVQATVPARLRQTPSYTDWRRMWFFYACVPWVSLPLSSPPRHLSHLFFSVSTASSHFHLHAPLSLPPLSLLYLSSLPISTASSSPLHLRTPLEHISLPLSMYIMISPSFSSLLPSPYHRRISLLHLGAHLSRTIDLSLSIISTIISPSSSLILLRSHLLHAPLSPLRRHNIHLHHHCFRV